MVDLVGAMTDNVGIDRQILSEEMLVVLAMIKMMMTVSVMMLTINASGNPWQVYPAGCD